MEPAAFYKRTLEFTNQDKVGDDRGMPIVAPPPGADVYLRQAREGTARKLQGLEGEEPVPVRHGAPLLDSEHRQVGVVTSGTISPSTQRAIMLGYVGSTEQKLFASVRGATRPVRVASLPFVPKRYKKS